MEALSTHPTPTPRSSRRRDAVTWVLTGVTATVLVVGVLVVRSTRSDRTPVVTDPPGPPTPPVEKTETQPPVFLYGEPEHPAGPR